MTAAKGGGGSAGERAIEWGEYRNPEGTKPDRQLAYEGDERFYRIVAYSLGVAISLSIVCSLIAVLYGESVPNGITAIGSGAVGALAGVFTASKR